MAVYRSLAVLLSAGLFGFGCRTPPRSAEPGPVRSAALAGLWRGVLTSPGGPLPFGLRIEAPGATPPAVIINGDEAAPISDIAVEGREVHLHMRGYDAALTARLSSDGDTLTGRWHKTIPGGQSELPFVAHRGATPRFAESAARAASAASSVETVAGSWAVTFTDEDGDSVARGDFVERDGRVTGTFATATGDYRYLAGDYTGGRLRLSTFDGAHAFLFVATAQADGTLAGDFWSRDVYHATWVAKRRAPEAEAVLPDPYKEVTLVASDGRLDFSFEDVDGKAVSLSDARFAGRVVLVDVFGTWCPNCNDQAPLLADWHRRYRDRGLQVIGLAYEFTGDVTRDRRMLRVYAETHHIEFPLLLAGTSSKKLASTTLPALSGIKSYPTTIFIGRDGQVKKIHSGFAGPATGVAHTKLVAEFEETIEALLAEPAGG